MIFLLPHGLVGHCNSVICVDRIDRLDGWHDGPVCDAVACECVGDHLARLTALAFQYAAEETHRRLCITSALHQNINGIAVLIHCTPEILPLPLNGDEHFVDVPGIL